MFCWQHADVSTRVPGIGLQKRQIPEVQNCRDITCDCFSTPESWLLPAVQRVKQRSCKKIYVERERRGMFKDVVRGSSTIQDGLRRFDRTLRFPLKFATHPQSMICKRKSGKRDQYLQNERGKRQGGREGMQRGTEQRETRPCRWFTRCLHLILLKTCVFLSSQE